MRGKIDYLEKYSVAPSPSRDYYGLKVLRDEVVLYHWKISHGPHKTPIVRAVSFQDFEQDKSLQDDIRLVFGGRLLSHTINIVRGKTNILLTLPKCLIERLLSYLTVHDIVKLSSLSYVSNQIYDDNSIWEILYKRSKCNKLEKLRSMAYEWKELFKQEYMQMRGKQKNPQIRPTAKLIEGRPKKEETATRKPLRLKDSLTNAMAKKPADLTQKKVSGGFPATRKSQGIPPDKLSVFGPEQKSSQKKTPSVGSLQTIGQRSTRNLREQHTVQSVRNVSREETRVKPVSSSKSMDSKSTKEPSEINRHLRNAKSKATAVKSTVQTPSNCTVRNTEKKLGPRATSKSDQNKGKVKGKPKAGQSKSTLLRTEKALVNDSLLVKDSSFDLADLIRTSMKNIRSPRGIFDYDFSALEKLTGCSGDGKLADESHKTTESSKVLKVSRGSVLERLSEKSEPLTGKSTGAEKKIDTGAAFPGSERMRFPGSDRKNERSCGIPKEKREFERYAGYGKFSAPGICEDIQEKGSSTQKTLDRMEILRSLGERTGRNSGSTKNRGESKGTFQNSYRERLRECD